MKTPDKEDNMKKEELWDMETIAKDKISLKTFEMSNGTVDKGLTDPCFQDL